MGGTRDTGGIIAGSPAGTLGGPTAGTATAGAAVAGETVPLTSVPAQVQGVLQPFNVNGQVGTVTQQRTQNGIVYRATVTQNGVPMEMQIAPNGRVLSRTAVPGDVSGGAGAGAGTGLGVNNATAGALGNAQAGIPITTLPQNIQNSIRSQLGNSAVQTISRDDGVNGSMFRVTAMQNGVPTEFRFAGNGALISSSPISGSATSTIVPGAAVVGTPIALDTLPASLRGAISARTGNAPITGVTQQQTPNGLAYWVNYTQNGQPARMLVGADGQVLATSAANGATGAPAPAATGAGGDTNVNRNFLQQQGSGANRPRSENIRMEDLPSAVAAAIRDRSENAEVQTITKNERPTGDVYTVSFRDDTGFTEVTFDRNGRLIRDRGDEAVEAAAVVGVETSASSPTESPQALKFNRLPVAVQNAVKAYATASDVQSVTLGLEDDKTIYDVIFHRDGRRDRMIVAKDGTMLRIEQNAPPALELRKGDESMTLAIGDLPQPVQDTIRRQTDGVLVKEVATTQLGNEQVYQVNYETAGAPRSLYVGLDGSQVFPETGAPLGEGDSLPAPPPEKEAVPVRTIDVGAQNADVTGDTPAGQESSLVAGAGASATAETGAGTLSSDSDLRLSDVPEGVRNTAKKLAGTALLQSISPRLESTGVVYEVTIQQNGETKTLLVNKAGEVIQENE